MTTVNNSLKGIFVGVTNYENPRYNLLGPDNDIQDITNTFHEYFGMRKYSILENERAKRSNVLRYLNAIVETADSGDNIIFYFSGHGSQIIDRNNDEIDQLDEIFCTYDFPNHITDDDIYNIVQKLNPEASIDFIVDCCHSGTITREIGSIERYIQDEFMTQVIQSNQHKIRNSFPKNKDNIHEKKVNQCLWSACRSDQTAKEVPIGILNRKVRGVFTYNFCKLLRSTKGNISRIDFAHKLKIHKKYEQNPQLECSRNLLEEKIFNH